MALTKSDIPLLLTAGLQTAFMTGYSEYVAGIYPLICTEIKSNKSLETYDWLGATPKMQEWIS